MDPVVAEFFGPEPERVASLNENDCDRDAHAAPANVTTIISTSGLEVRNRGYLRHTAVPDTQRVAMVAVADMRP
jgi:hypothetical protein